MKVRILILGISLVLVACKEPQVSSGEPQIEPPLATYEAQTATPSPSAPALYLLRRVAVASEDSLYGLEAGTELYLIEERPARLLVQAQGMQFEIDPRDTTSDRDEAQRSLARAREGKAIRPVALAAQWQIEDQKFLAAENLRRSTTEQIAHLRASIDSATSQIARLQARPTLASNDDRHAARDMIPDRTPLEESARHQWISLLQAYIADCNREIQTLSVTVPDEE